MLELLNDLWSLILTLFVAVWNVLCSLVDLIIIADPFWRGVELTIITLVVWNNRKELISLIDRIPLLGGLLAKGLNLADASAEYILSKAHAAWVAVRANTWDRAVSFILKTDADLRD